MWSTPTPGLPFEADFRAATQRYALPDGLLSRVAWQESRYNPQAYNAASGAVGLMQIIPRFHPAVDAWDPRASIDYAGGWLRELRDRFGAWALALAAYNAGPAAVERYGGIPPYPETEAYVAAILADIATGPGAGALFALGVGAWALYEAVNR